ncbi:unnamed protein product [Effrenium voratum]|nr:unnamed protein product [Effrenium voratum]
MACVRRWIFLGSLLPTIAQHTAEGGGPAGACSFILQELVKASERTCFDDLPEFLCCNQPPSIGCFRDEEHRNECCEAPFSTKVLAQDLLVALVTREQQVLQRNCPFAAALTQLVPYLMEEDIKLSSRIFLQHELIPLARAMSFAGAGWSNLLQSPWPVFGVLRRVQERRLKVATSDQYYQTLEKSSASPVLALAQLNSSQCITRVTARLHLALAAEKGPPFEASPAAQLIDEAELQAVRCELKLLPRLRLLLTSPAPVMMLLHQLWQQMRSRGWRHLTDQAQNRKPTSLTMNACLCQPSWEVALSNGSYTCSAEDFGCCDPYGTKDFFCPTQPGCYQSHDVCFPRKHKIGGPGVGLLAEVEKDFLRMQSDGRVDAKCRQIAAAAGARPASKVLDVGAGTAPCKPVMEKAGLAYTSQDAMAYTGTEGIAGSVFLHGYADIDIVSDIIAIPLPSGSFDVVICTDVLEHVVHPQEAVQEIGRLLAPGGVAFLQVPFGGALHNLPHHYYAGFTHRWFENISASAGLKVAWGYHFETLAKRIQRSLQSEECLSGLFGASSASAWKHHVINDLPAVLDHLRACQSNPEGAVDQAFPSGIRAMLMKPKSPSSARDKNIGAWPPVGIG